MIFPFDCQTLYAPPMSGGEDLFKPNSVSDYDCYDATIDAEQIFFIEDSDKFPGRITAIMMRNDSAIRLIKMPISKVRAVLSEAREYINKQNLLTNKQ